MNIKNYYKEKKHQTILNLTNNKKYSKEMSQVIYTEEGGKILKRRKH